MSRALRILAGVMGLLFLLGAAVQYNDPDPLRWVLMYGVSAACCALFVLGRLPRSLPLLVGALALVWAAMLAPGVIGEVGFLDLFREIGMDSVEIEVGREAFGLALIAGWMAVLYFANPDRRRPTAAG